MTEPAHQFRVVLRGYDPAQVDRRVQELDAAATEARQQLYELSGRVRDLEQERARLQEERSRAEDRGDEEQQEPAGPPSFAHLGERVGQILTLAEEEAEELLARARQEIDAERESLSTSVGRIRGEADRYAAERRRDADTEAARVLEDARRVADERIDAADRDAAARLQEAEAVYEQQRAKAAQAAADFETTLAARRQAAEAEFTQQMQESERRLEELEQHIRQSRGEAEATQQQAAREARRALEEAEEQAARIVAEAKGVAARVRADSERELAAATQRRDSINAQLANVRQMLATLTGTAPAALVDDAFGPTVPARPAGDGGETGGVSDAPAGKRTETADDRPEEPREGHDLVEA